MLWTSAHSLAPLTLAKAWHFGKGPSLGLAMIAVHSDAQGQSPCSLKPCAENAGANLTEPFSSKVI